MLFNQFFNDLNLAGISAEDLAKALAASASNRARQRAMVAKNQQQQSVNAAAAAATEISSQSSSSVLPPAGSGDNRVSVPAGSAAHQQQPRRPGVSSKSHVCLPACLTTYQIVLQVVMLK